MVGGEYFDLEQESERVRLDLEWDRLAAGRVRVLLDEAQSFPAVFPRLRAAIDRDRRRKGRFLLLASVSPMLLPAPGRAPMTVGKGRVIGRPSMGMAMFRAELPTVATLRWSMVLFASAFRPKKVKNREASMPPMRAPLAMISAG